MPIRVPSDASNPLPRREYQSQQSRREHEPPAEVVARRVRDIVLLRVEIVPEKLYAAYGQVDGRIGQAEQGVIQLAVDGVSLVWESCPFVVARKKVTIARSP